MFLKSLLTVGLVAASLTTAYAADEHKSDRQKNNKERYLVLAIGLKNVEDPMQKQDVQYKCDATKEPKLAVLPSPTFKVRYINIGDNSLAIVPLKSGDIVMANVISADGARYTSGVYTWWSKGDEVLFSDATTMESGERTCHEIK